MVKLYEIPAGWGDDSLSKFQDSAIRNEMWSHSQKSTFNQLASECDELIYNSVTKAAPKNKSQAGDDVLLFVNAHNHFRAAARLCLSGQFLPVYPTARASLETAVYGWALSTNKNLVEQWLNKPKAAEWEKLKAWNKTFSFSALANSIGEVELPLKESLKHLHQIAIDFGGHPNKAALYTNLVRIPDEDLDLYTIGYIHQEGKLLYFTSSFLIEIAIGNLLLIKMAHPNIVQEGDFAAKYNALAIKAKEFQNYAYGEMGWASRLTD